MLTKHVQQIQKKNHCMHSVYAAGVVCAVFFNFIMICVFFPFRHTVFLFSFFPQKFKNLHKLHQMLKTPSPQWFSSSNSCTKPTPETTSTTPEKTSLEEKSQLCRFCFCIKRKKRRRKCVVGVGKGVVSGVVDDE